jgi:Domain of unknown function (DUF6531)
MSTSESPFINRPLAELFGSYPGYGFAGFGVSTAIGNYTENAVDLGFPGGLLGLLDFRRTYNSLIPESGGQGNGWTFSFSARLTSAQGLQASPPGPVTFSADDGRVLTFNPDPAGGYFRAQDLDADLTHNADGT